jgi:hypothetical protein
MAYANFVVSESLAILFLVAATAKVLRSGVFSNTLRELGVPLQLVRPVALATVGSELFASVSLMTLPTAVSTAVVAVLLGGFTFAAFSGLRHSTPVSCACFGSSTEVLGLPTLVRAGLIALGLVVVLWTGSAGNHPPYPPSVQGLATATVTAGGVIAVGAWLLTIPALTSLVKSRRRRDQIPRTPSRFAELNGRIFG